MHTIIRDFAFNKMITVSVIFAALILCPHGITCGIIAGENAQTNASQSLELTEKEIDQVLEGLENLNQAISQASQEIPRDTFDPQTIVDNVGENPKSLFQWVRDKTLLVPYRGSLRGPTGVLMDRCGNSLDRALLLHELLHLAGYEVRLAQASLSEDIAKDILASISYVKNDPQEHESKTDFENLIQVYAQEYTIDAQELQEIKGRLSEEKDRISTAIRQKVSEQTKALAALLKTEQEKRSDMVRMSATKALRDHWWVQVEENGDWLDLDPTIMNAKPGEHLVSVENTWEVEDLDDDLFHSLIVRIIVERWEDGGFEEETVLEQDLRPSNLFGEPIELNHEPLGWPKDDELYNNDQPIQTLKDTVKNLEEWIPTLTLGSEKIGEQSFTESGNVNEKPGEKTEKKGGGLTGGLTGAFGGSRTKTDASSKLTAEWIEFEIHSPNQPIRKIRRSVFDLIGPAKRKSSSSKKPQFNNAQILKRNLLMLGTIEILPLSCQLSPEFVEYLSAREMLSNMEVLISLLEERNALDNEDFLVQLGLISPLPGPLYNLALARSSLSRFGEKIYLNGLNIFSLQTFLDEDTSEDLVEFQRIDIIRNDLAVFPDSTQNPFMINLEQGILETNTEVEHLVADVWTENTALLFAESLKQGIDWLVIRDAGDPALQKTQMSQDSLSFIKNDLSDGYIAIIPPKPIPINGQARIGWWRIDPRTGTTLGMGPNGAGQALTQYARNVNLVLQLKTAISIHADIMRCMAAAITAPLRGNRPQHDRLTIKCIWMTVCKNASTLAKKFIKIDVNWTNIIISKTISSVMKGLCKALWKEIEK